MGIPNSWMAMEIPNLKWMIWRYPHDLGNLRSNISIVKSNVSKTAGEQPCGFSGDMVQLFDGIPVMDHGNPQCTG